MITVLYPLVIWLSHGQIEPRWLAGLLLLAAATRLPTFRLSKVARWSAAGAIVLAGVAVWANILLPLKLYPVLVSCVMFGVFAYSLRFPPNAIERLALLKQPQLHPLVIIYTRRVTQIWCVFFVINGSISLATAVWASEAVWSLYTGLVSYILMGILLGGELLYRPRFKRLNHI